MHKSINRRAKKTTRIPPGILLLAVLGGGPLKAWSLDMTPDGASISAGQFIKDTADLRSVRLALQWDWNLDLPGSPVWQLDGYFDLGFSQLRSHLSAEDRPSPGGADSSWRVGFSPVFRLSPASHQRVTPLLDFGAGASYHSEKNLQKKLNSPINTGGHGQFEIRTMVGIAFGAQQNLELSYGWFHYSNAHLYAENEALDFQVLSLRMKW